MTADSVDILRPDAGRFTLFPIRDAEIWEMYKNSVASFWTVDEVNLARDRQDWVGKLVDDERRFLSIILAFFASADGIVGENLLLHLAGGVQIPEARCFYGFQIMMENIHAEMYSLLIDVLVEDQTEKTSLLDAIRLEPTVRRKAGWAIKWMEDPGASYAQRVVAFAAVECIFFSASFAAIFWVRKRGFLPGLTFSNDLIARDEGMHVKFACLIHSRLTEPLPSDSIRAIVEEAVCIEKAFVADILPVPLIGMNSSLLQQYTEYVGDCLLGLLGQPAVFGVPNPFDFMDMISMQGKSNFFEKRVAEYSKAGIAKNGQVDFSITEEF